MTVSAKDYELKEGLNSFEGFMPANATFTPDVDGKVLVEAQEVFVVKYDGKEVKYSYVPGSDYAYTYEVEGVKAGEAVTVTSDFVWNGGSKVRITMFPDGGAIPVKILSCSPKTDEVFAWYTSGNVTVNFNKNVTISSVKLKAGDYTADVDDVHLGSSFGFDVTNALNNALKEGKLNPGDEFQIVVSGLRDAADKNNLYNGDGVFVMNYIAPHRQSCYVKASVGETELTYTHANAYEFLSYYSPEGEDGLIVIEFDGDIKSANDVYMSMGNLDLDAVGKFHRSSLPYRIEGNKMIIDARGKLRTLAVLFPAVQEEEAPEDGQVNEGLGQFDTEHVTITVSNVVDVNGNAVRTDLPGSVGSFSFVMNYKELIDEAYIDGDNKFDGDNVKSGEEIKLWLSNPSIKFDGIAVSYFVESSNPDDELAIMEQRVIVVKDFSAVPDAVEGEIITFTMPDMEGVVDGTTVRVALNDAASADGMPHYLYLEFKAAGGVPNAIANVEDNKSHEGIYNLNGIKVNKTDAKSGLFIVNGKTVFIK